MNSLWPSAISCSGPQIKAISCPFVAKYLVDDDESFTFEDPFSRTWVMPSRVNSVFASFVRRERESQKNYNRGRPVHFFTWVSIPFISCSSAVGPMEISLLTQRAQSALLFWLVEYFRRFGSSSIMVQSIPNEIFTENRQYALGRKIAESDNSYVSKFMYDSYVF